MSRSLQKFTSMKLVLMVALLAAGVCAAPTAEAQDELRVAYVDLQKALASSKAGQRAQKGYEAEVKKAQASIDKQRVEYESLRKSFEKQRESLNEKARLEKEEELLEMERDLKRAFKDSQDSLRRKNGLIVTDLLKQMREAVEQVGRSRKLTIILEKGAQAVLYADNSIDITDEVVERFDEMKR